MKRSLRWKNTWQALLVGALFASLFFNYSQFNVRQSDKWAMNYGISETMILIQNADSQLQGTIRMIENGAGAAESLYAIGELRSRLSEAAGRFWILTSESGHHTNAPFYTLGETLHEFDTFLRDDLTAGWQESEEAFDASREQTLLQLKSMKKDTGALASLAQEPRDRKYDLDELVGQWRSKLQQRIQEEPDMPLHKRLTERYGL